jgi:uncharacterized protein (DUF2267 family)
MEELLNLVTQKTGLSLDQARSAVMAVLGFVRGKLPADKAGQFDSVLAKLGQTGPLPAGAPDMAALADKTGLAAGQAGSLLETVMTFLKDKLPPDLVTTLTAAVSKGGLSGVAQKVAGMFGRG